MRAPPESLRPMTGAPFFIARSMILQILRGVGLGERAAEDGEVLGEDVDQAAVDAAVAADHAVARDLLVAPCRSRGSGGPPARRSPRRSRRRGAARRARAPSACRPRAACGSAPARRRAWPPRAGARAPEARDCRPSSPPVRRRNVVAGGGRTQGRSRRPSAGSPPPDRLPRRAAGLRRSSVPGSVPPYALRRPGVSGGRPPR